MPLKRQESRFSYYVIAPRIVAAIQDRIDSKAIYARILDEMILPSVDAIRQRKCDDAFELYRTESNRLIRKSESIV